MKAMTMKNNIFHLPYNIFHLQVKHDHIKQNWDKLKGKVILDCHNICPLEGVYHI